MYLCILYDISYRLGTCRVQTLQRPRIHVWAQRKMVDKIRLSRVYCIDYNVYMAIL